MKETKSNILGWLLLSFTLGALAGCSDDNDSQDETTTPEEVTVDISATSSLTATIEAVTIDANTQVSVDFYLSNLNGVAVSGLTALDSIATLGVGIAKLGQAQPLRPNKDLLSDYNSSGTMAEGKEWISYINSEVAPASGANSGAVTEWQAGIESSCKLDCITSLGGGHYRYIFSKALTAYPQFTGLDTSYDADATTRLYLELLPASDSDVSTMLVNVSYDFVPASGAEIDSDAGRQLIDPAQSCYRCHTASLADTEHRLLMHGGKRFAYEGCVLCHTTYAGDPETGNAIDMATLVHRIHQADYKVVGYNATLHNYSGVHYPGDITDCQSCHIDSAAAQASQYYIPGNNSCLSCHQQQQDAASASWNGSAATLFHDRDLFADAWQQSCAGCHPDATNPLGAGVFHQNLPKTRSSIKSDYGLSLSSVTLTDNTLQVSIAFDKLTVLPAQDNAIKALYLVVNGNPDTLTRPENNGQHQLWDIHTSGSDVSLSMAANQLTATITGIDSSDFGTAANAIVSAKLLVCADSSARTSVACGTDAADTEVEVIASGPLDLAGASASRTARAEESRCVACHDSEMPQRLQSAHVMASNFAPGNDSCGSCHNPSGATALTDGTCNSCHNPDTVAYMNASLYHTAGSDQIKPFRSVNNSLNYREMVHSLHAGTRTVQGMGASRATATYPQSANNCYACHAEGQLDFAALKLENSQLLASPSATEAGQIVELSPTVASCGGCHTNVADWAAHAASFGGVYATDASGGRTYTAGGETCELCHAEGKAYGVDKLHGLAD